jgi:hypothetical protein
MGLIKISTWLTGCKRITRTVTARANRGVSCGTTTAASALGRCGCDHGYGTVRAAGK